MHFLPRRNPETAVISDRRVFVTHLAPGMRVIRNIAIPVDRHGHLIYAGGGVFQGDTAVFDGEHPVGQEITGKEKLDVQPDGGPPSPNPAPESAEGGDAEKVWERLRSMEETKALKEDGPRPGSAELNQSGDSV